MKEKVNVYRCLLPFIIMICVLGTAMVPAAETRLKVGIYHNPPIVFVDEKGTPQGVYVDTLNAIAGQEKWTLDYVFAQWDELLEKLKSGEIDLVTAIAFSPDRDTWLDFSREAFTERWGVVYAPAGTPIHAMADLNKKRVALARKDIHAGFFKQAAKAMGLEFTPVEMMGYESVFQAIKDHKADAGVVSNGYGDSNADSYRIKSTSLTFKPTHLVTAFPEGKHHDIAVTIDTYLKKWKDDPDSVYLASYRRWLGTPRLKRGHFALTPDQRAWLTAHPAVRVAFDGYFPPYSYLTEDDRVEGLSVDVLRVLADRIGIRFDIYPTFVWKDLFEAAKRQEVDIVATIVQRPEREQWFVFTRPYIYKSLTIITRDDDKSIKNREDIAGKRVALVRDYQYVPKILKDFPSLKPYYVDTMLDGLNAVATENADAAVTFFSAGSYLKTKYGITNLKFAAIYDRSTALESIGVRKDWPELAAILDKALSAIEQTELQALQRKWNTDEVLVNYFQESRFNRQWKAWLLALAVIAGLSLFAFASVSAWNRTLRGQVKAKTLALEDELLDSSQMASALQESENRYRAVSELTSDYAYSFRIEPDGKLANEWVTGALTRTTGYSHKELQSLGGWERLIHPDDMTVALDQLQALLSNKAKTVEYRIITKDNQVRWVRDYARPTWDETESRVTRIKGAIQDVTERKRSEEALKTSHERFLTVLDSIDATIYVANMETYEILFMNKNIIESFGGDRTGGICWDVFRRESEPCRHCTNDQLIDENGNPTGVCVWQDKNPVNGKWYINYDRAIEWTDGRLVRLQIATDISDLKKMEEELRQSRKMESIGTLTGGIAHDFNNILYMIVGNAELALEDIPEWNPVHSNLKGIKDAGLRAAGIVKQLLNFSRKTDQELKPIGAITVIKDALKFLRSTIPTTIEIRNHLPETDVTILADPIQINQVLMNICTNASQAMEETGGILEINVEKESLTEGDADYYPDLTAGEYVKITLSDTGPGIESEIMDRIFDPYFTTKEVGKGSGLGLAVVHGIVKNHGGAITVDNQPGNGATFTILLPAVAEKPVTEVKAPDAIPRGDETILFVDDEESIVNITGQMLERLGYKVETEIDPIKALERFRSKPANFDLIITDMTMPHMTGVRLSEKLKVVRSDIPVIICTGHSSLIDEEKAKGMGIAAYVMKPIVMQEIAKTIRNVLDAENEK